MAHITREAALGIDTALVGQRGHDGVPLAADVVARLSTPATGGEDTGKERQAQTAQLTTSA